MNNKVILIAVLVIAAVAAAGIYGARSFLAPPPPTAGLASPQPDAAPELPPNLPPLEESDAFVRKNSASLIAAPAFQEWLKLESLIPRLTSAMIQITDGQVPRDTFSRFAPRGKYRVLKQDGRLVPDPASYARYDAFTAMVASVDAVAAARLFERLLPLFDAAQRGIGETPGARDAFLAAARSLLAAPVPEGEVVLKEGKKGITWTYADEKLENLTPAQKQLVRMGPKNQAIVQAKLKAVVLALGR